MTLHNNQTINKVSHSLRTTLFLMVMGPLFITFLIGTGTSFIVQQRRSTLAFKNNFIQSANQKSLELNECFDSTMRAVDSISSYVMETLKEDRLLIDADYEKSYMDNLSGIMEAITQTAKEPVAAYFRLNADKYGPRSGVFITGSNKSGFIRVRPTDISLYTPTDIENVGWYYLPRWEGRAIWLSPYEDTNINMHIFSYVRPLFKNDEFIGVVGIDMNMASLKNISDNLHDENMSALVLGADYELIYYNETYQFDHPVDTTLDIRGMRQILEEGSENELYDVKWDEEMRFGTFKRLQNGMVFILLIPKKIATRETHLVLIRFFLIFLIILAFGLIVLKLAKKHILLPIEDLTKASYRLSRGELGIPISYKSDNELGLLAESIKKMAVQLYEYIEYIREQAKSEREAKESAINASKAKSNFLANMSHEIRTPINAVLGMNEMILRETKRDDIRTYAINIKHAGNALLALVNDVLDFSKIESGKMDLIQDTYNLSSMLIDILSIVYTRLEKNGLEFILDVDEKMPSVLYGDSAKLKQCILNLMTNAIKYTQKGSVTLSIKYHDIPYSDGTKIALEIKVSDTGIGIKKEDLNKLFLPFERIEENRNRTVEGTGLGMSIVQRILEVMDTKLEVESEYGSGSQFSFSVVQNVVSKQPLGNVLKQYNEKIQTMDIYHERLIAPDARILFIDDTLMNLEVVKGLLKNTKIQLDTVLSGEEGLELARKNKYDILFIDHRMPKMDGIETLEALNKMSDNMSAGAPCIALTANAVSGAKEMYLQAGFTDYLSKPVSPEKLEEMIRKYLPEEMIKDPKDYEDDDGENSETEASAAAAASSGKTAIPQIDGIDLKTARTYCGSDELMLKMFTLFQSSVQKNADEIEDLWKSKDIEQYRIKVHALKSSARTIGATELSEKALALEMAAAENKLEQIDADTAALLELYRSFADKLLVFAADSKPAASEKKDDRAPFTDEDIKKCLEDLKSGCENFDLDLLENTVGELQMHDLPSNFKENFKKIREFVKDVDFEGLAEFLKNL